MQIIDENLVWSLISSIKMVFVCLSQVFLYQDLQLERWSFCSRSFAWRPEKYIFLKIPSELLVILEIYYFAWISMEWFFLYYLKTWRHNWLKICQFVKFSILNQIWIVFKPLESVKDLCSTMIQANYWVFMEFIHLLILHSVHGSLW